MRSKWLWTVLGLVAVLGITTAANATVRGLITGKQIAAHTINSKNLVDHTIQVHDLSSTAVKSLQGAKGDTGATGAAGSSRAYGLIVGTGTISAAKNVAGVTNPEVGVFCITFTADAGIDPTSTGLIVTPYQPLDATAFGPNAPQAFAEWKGTCIGSGGATGLGVVTAVRWQQAGSVGGLGTGTFLTRVNNEKANQPFFFLVP